MVDAWRYYNTVSKSLESILLFGCDGKRAPLSGALGVIEMSQFACIASIFSLTGVFSVSKIFLPIHYLIR